MCCVWGFGIGFGLFLYCICGVPPLFFFAVFLRYLFFAFHIDGFVWLSFSMLIAF